MQKLTPEQLQFWQYNSYLLIKGLFASRARDLSHWINEVLSWRPMEGIDDSKWLTDYEVDNPKQLARRENFVPFHPNLAGILMGEEVTGIVSQFIGEGAILYKERVNPKFPGGGAHEAHQDGVAFEQFERGERFFDPHKKPYISVLIGVDRATTTNGCLEVTPNWPIDRLDILPMESPYLDRPHYFKIAKIVEDALYWLKLQTNPGDALFFTERLPHRSAKNRSNNTRKILYAVYNPISEGEKRTRYYEDKIKDRDNPRYHVGNPHALLSEG